MSERKGGKGRGDSYHFDWQTQVDWGYGYVRILDILYTVGGAEYGS
jgi:hypothetical protein